MPERSQVLVTNTTPLIALTAATGSLDVLRFLYTRVVVPLEVAQEIRTGGKQAFGVAVFEGADWLDVQDRTVELQPFLRNSLDRGEAAAIQTALNLSLPLVCIDETAGRRIARLCALNIPDALQRMRDHGIWLSGQVVKFALSPGH